VSKQQAGTLDAYLTNPDNAGDVQKALSHLDLAELQYLHDNLTPAQLQQVVTIAGGKDNLALGNPDDYGAQKPIQGTFPDDGTSGNSQQRVNALLNGNPNPPANGGNPPTPGDNGTPPPGDNGNTPPGGAPGTTGTPTPGGNPTGATGAGVKGGPFGGAILVPPIKCDDQTLLLKLGPPTPGFYVWPPTVPPYRYNPPKVVGQWLLGMASLAPVPCTVDGDVIGEGFLILYNGASLAGGKSAGVSSQGTCSGGSCSLGSSSGLGASGQSLGSAGSSSFGSFGGMLVNLAGGVLGNVLGKLGGSSSQNSLSGFGNSSIPTSPAKTTPFGGAVLSLLHCDAGVLVKLGSPTPGYYLWQSNPQSGLINPPRSIGYLKGQASVSRPCLVNNKISGHGLLIVSMSQTILGVTLP
ncbi:MAG: hypothetical protein PHV42_03545, partial [Candidatus Pacebacteria bacterium]|nr:hypothetical protein [Candidatus Paceibacterota bacterium]